MDNNNHIIELLRTFSQTGNLVRVYDAEQALQPFGDETVSAMVQALGDPDPELRILALKILEHFEAKSEPALPAMIRALQDPHRIVRICALEPVASFGAKAIDAVPILEKWIGSDDEFRHVSAVGHILMIAPSKFKILLPILLKALESDDIGIRCQAAWLLGQLGELSKEAVPELRRLTDNDDSSVRSIAQFSVSLLYVRRTPIFGFKESVLKLVGRLALPSSLYRKHSLSMSPFNS